VEWIGPTVSRLFNHISSFSNNISLVEIVVDLPHDNPEVDSITPLDGEGANWHERRDLRYVFAASFSKDIPNLKRLLLPEDYTFLPVAEGLRGRRTGKDGRDVYSSYGL